MLDIRKMDRPHRSGVLAIAVAYALLYVAVDFTSLGNLGNGTWKDLVLCHLVPVACIDLSARATPPPPKPEYSVTRLVYCPTCKIKTHEDECKEVFQITDFDGHKYPAFECPNFAAFESWYSKHEGQRAWIFPSGAREAIFPVGPNPGGG